MIEQTSEVVTNYLNELNDALHDVEAAVRRDIVNGVREELHGLEPREAQRRIADLGDPAFIASEASEGLPLASAHASPVPSREGVGYTVVATLLVALGGVIVPVLGWLAGLVMIWLSRQWWRWEKIVATLGPAAVVALVLALVFLLSRSQERGAVVNPLIPVLYDSWWSGGLLLILCNLIVGMWLLWRAQRTSRPVA